MLQDGQLHIGTSGWSYPEWKGVFYPATAGQNRFLPLYMEQFKTVEVNSAFYRLPNKTLLNRWKELAPEGFIYSFKANRAITHINRLVNVEDALAQFFQTIAPLEKCIDVVLFQLPPSFSLSLESLAQFISLLPPNYRYTFEFRHPSWFTDEVYSLLGAHQCAFCIYDLGGKNSPRQLTADFAYIRLHGPEKIYEGRYDQPALESWRDTIVPWLKDGKDVYCYFDNSKKGDAPRDALALREMIQSEMGKAPVAIARNTGEA